MKKNIYAITLILIGLFISSCKKDLSDIINESEKASFIIYTYDEYGSPSGSGSGFFIEKSGIAITNYHVLDGAVKAVIITNDSSKYEIEKIIASDSKKDLLKFKIKNIDQKTFPTLKFSKNTAQKGDKVYCISNPLGLENSLSEGIISAFRSDKLHGKTIQFSAPISPGSSGGAVVNGNGDVIAIASFMKRGGQNLNFGILVNDEILNSINDEGFSKKNPKFALRDNFIVLNVKSDNDPFIVLNAIEFGDDLTTLYLTYTNLNMTSAATNWGIWIEPNKNDEGFWIKDLEKNSKSYLVSSTVGEDMFHPTKIPLATSFRYKLFFSKTNSKLKRIDLSEGTEIRYPRWSGINLDDFKNVKNFDINKFQNVYAFSSLKEGNWLAAQSMFYEILDTDPENIEALTTLGVISFATDNKSDALYYFNKAIESNPTLPISYVNRHFVYVSQNNIRSAIEDISKAISLSPTQSDYYGYRKKLYLQIGDAENALLDGKKADDLFVKQSGIDKMTDAELNALIKSSETK